MSKMKDNIIMYLTYKMLKIVWKIMNEFRGPGYKISFIYSIIHE